MIGTVRFRVMNPDGTLGENQYATVGGTITVPQPFTAVDNDGRVHIAGTVTTVIAIMEVTDGPSMIAESFEGTG